MAAQRPKWLQRERAEAKEVGPYTGNDLPKYEKGKSCPVTLPSRGPEGGWKAGTREEWDKVFYYDREKDECGLSYEHWRALADLHMRAYYASGSMLCDCSNVKDTIDMFMKNGLACAPWREGRHFWGLKNSVKQAKARRSAVLRVETQKSHDKWIEHLIEILGEAPDGGLEHSVSYDLEAAKAALREIAGRGDIEIPSNKPELKKLLGKILGSSGVCPDCLIEKLLVILEHAKGGPNAGKVRSRPCPQCNTAGRAFTDVLIAVAHALAETLTAEDHALVAKLAVAHARPGQATRDATRRLARARRLAAGATVAADEEALAYVSRLRGDADDDDEEDEAAVARRQRREAPCGNQPVSQVASTARGDVDFDFHTGEAAIEAEEARLAARRQREKAAARLATLPPIRPKMRVVVKATGARGVVQHTGGSGQWYHVELDGAPGTTKGYRRGQLEIDKSRKPSARKPAAKKPSKKKARK